MSDTLVYDMSMTQEASPSIFVKKDVLTLMDTQNGVYNGGQCIIDTSQLANSNKYVDYRNAYLTMPMCLTLVAVPSSGYPEPEQPSPFNSPMSIGLKNNFASIIHSMTLDYAGVTILQQTAMCQMFQNFTLMTTLSLQDVMLNGPTIGFFPDTAAAVRIGPYSAENTTPLVQNNNNSGALQQIVSPYVTNGSNSVLFTEASNDGFLQRQKHLLTGNTLNNIKNISGQYYSMLLTESNVGLLHQVQAIIRLRDIHPFFNQIPLLKGVFFRLTLNLNQTAQTFKVGQESAGSIGEITNTDQNVPLGGVSMIMIAGAAMQPTNLFQQLEEDDTGNMGANILAAQGSAFLSQAGGAASYRAALCVGNRPIDAQTLTTYSTNNKPNPITMLSPSVQLNVPSYTFAPSYEESYLASPSKTILYTDIFQYTTPKTSSGSFNFLISNGIANIKSVLILPFFTSSGTGVSGQKPWQSPFDPAGCGPTSQAHITNFNVVIAGQNMIYNTQKYSYEQYLNQLQGVNSVNGNLINGLTSSLVSQTDFAQEYCYYYCNTSRGLPIDESVPKSVMIQGENTSQQEVEYVVFVEYGIQVTVDVLTGSRI